MKAGKDFLETVYVKLNFSVIYIFQFQAKNQKGLTKLRNNQVFYFILFNSIFVATIFMCTIKKEILHIEWPLGARHNITITDLDQVSFKYRLI